MTRGRRIFWAAMLVLAAAVGVFLATGVLRLPVFNATMAADSLRARLQMASPARADRESLAEAVRLPQGFGIELHARVPAARSMVLGDRGTLFVGTRKSSVYAVLDAAGSGPAGEVRVLADGLRMPNGVAFRDGDLYVAEVSRVLRFEDIEDRLDAPPEPVVVRGDFPDETHHGWKYIAFGPDGLLYVPVGAPCNVCERDDPRYSAIGRMRPDGSDFEVFASGIRNTVGLAFHPATGVLWFTNNGRDHMGDDLPPDTLHRAPRAGMHFGFPSCLAKGLPDPEYGQGRACDGAVYDLPALEMPAHVAPLGLAFVPSGAWGPEWDGRLLWAEHGSWNRSKPIGYRLGMTTVQGGRAGDYEIFADGWLRNNRAWGRPVDLLFLPDGSLLVSDDRAGAIWRIRKNP